MSALRRGGGAATGGPVRLRGVVSRPQLFEALEHASRVTQVSGAAGSGKSVLLRSWLHEAGLADQAGWISTRREERDPQWFWLSVLDALRATVAGTAVIGELTPAPGLDGWGIVERLLADLAGLQERMWLVIDDVHELRSEEALRQLELLVIRAPARLRFMLLTRSDLRLGLHRLRLEGELTEIRAADLRFGMQEARALLQAAGAEVSELALELLVARTEGWAAGLRLAALSLAGHADPERLAAEFSGTDRTVAEYLLAEVLDHQPEEVRRLLLRTSVLTRVSGALADHLTGDFGGERILQDLEDAGAFTMSVDERRSWFRYHPLFADLLALELRRTAPHEIPALHRSAAQWLAGHGHAIDAIRHAQAAADWSLAAGLLFDHWSELHLDGHVATAHELLRQMPPAAVADNSELTVLNASAEVTRGSLPEAQRWLDVATREAQSVPAARRPSYERRLILVQLYLARRRGDVEAVLERAQPLLHPEAADVTLLAHDEALRALALISVGSALLWSRRHQRAQDTLEQGVAVARRVRRPYVELRGLAQLAANASLQGHGEAQERAAQAIELAREHGYGDEPAAAVAYAAMALSLTLQGRLGDADPWLARGKRTLVVDVDPATGMVLHLNTGLLALARGRDREALDAFRAANRLAQLLVADHPLSIEVQALALHTRIRLGQAEDAGDGSGAQERDSAEMRIAVAALRLSTGDPRTAMAELRPVLEGLVTDDNRIRAVLALILQAQAHDALGDTDAAHRELERALEWAQPDRLVWPFVLHPAPELLERQRWRSSHATMISDILALTTAGHRPVDRPVTSQQLSEPLSASELRVLRYLPTNLSVPEIAGELYLSPNTVRTHMRHLYAKLEAHRRSEAVEKARVLGLLAPSSR